jgi:hypothetical protein
MPSASGMRQTHFSSVKDILAGEIASSLFTTFHVNTPDGERFLQVLDGRFRLFALILSVSPQNLCGFHPIYYSLNGLISRQQTP